eukprot:GHUV01007291.1.p1 GENE.GHUV01007291.1~~GHUV01007291.1.p1  ORF type:complete len:111 (+),score=34.35 GHUV01007291.1:177-509(+)
MAPAGSSHANATLGLLCAAGGVLGFLKKRSMPSLVAGLAFGAAYGASAYIINVGDPATGHLCGLVSSLVLTGAMGARFAGTRKVMPAGVMAAAGVLGAVYNFQKHQEWTT